MTSESSDKAAWSIIYLSLRAQPRAKGVTVVFVESMVFLLHPVDGRTGGWMGERVGSGFRLVGQIAGIS